jgi:hypothetical protein
MTITTFTTTELETLIKNEINKVTSQISHDFNINKTIIDDNILHKWKLDLSTISNSNLVKEKKKRPINPVNFCLARKPNLEQCTRNRKLGSNFCASHQFNHPYGRINDNIPLDNIINKNKTKSKQKNKTKSKSKTKITPKNKKKNEKENEKDNEKENDNINGDRLQNLNIDKKNEEDRKDRKNRKDRKDRKDINDNDETKGYSFKNKNKPKKIRLKPIIIGDIEYYIDQFKHIYLKHYLDNKLKYKFIGIFDIQNNKINLK